MSMVVVLLSVAVVGVVSSLSLKGGAKGMPFHHIFIITY